ncbi:TSUP family transporter [Kaarinaea lacus]
MQLDFLPLLGSFLVIFIGSIVQAATGLGAGLLIVPFLALINIEFIPGPVIFASLALSYLMAYRGRKNISTQQLSVVFIGLVAGMITGAVILAGTSLDHLGIIFGFCILGAVLIIALMNHYHFTSAHKLIAGAIAGFMGTTAAIGAPVLALLYQFEDGKVIRATLGLIYFISSVLMLLFLHLAGHFGYEDVILGIYLIPGFVLGYLFADKAAQFVDRGYARPAVLVISAVSACALIIKNI